VGAVDRGSIEEVVRARCDDDPDPRLDEALELCRRALDGPPRLDVRVEQVARDEDEIHLLRQGKVDGRHEGRELPLPLCRGPIPEVRVPRAQVDGGGVEQSQHALERPPQLRPDARLSPASEAPPIAPRSPARTVAGNCDRSTGTLRPADGPIGDPDVSFGPTSPGAPRPRDSRTAPRVARRRLPAASALPSVPLRCTSRPDHALRRTS